KIVDKCARTLVAALTGTVDGSHRLTVVSIQSLDSVDKVLSGPGVRLQIQILVGSGRLERVHVDSHAVGGHNQRIFIHSAVGSGAGGQDGFLNFRAVLIGQHVRQIHHVPTGSPVGHK